MPSAIPSSSSSLPHTSLYPLAIIDVGSDSLRLCLEPTAPSSSSSSPIHRAPNAIARTRPPSKQVYVGSAIEERCPDYSGLILRLPIERGLITDWVAQKAIWDVEIARALKELKMLPGKSSAGGKLLEGWNLVITEAYMNLPELEAGLETMWFEEYGVRGVWRTTAAQLASFATAGVSQGAQTAASTKAQSSQLEATPKQPQTASSPPPTASDASQPLPAKRPRRSAAPASSPTSPPPTASSPDGGGSSKRPSTATRERQPRRPEACLIVDLGNSYIHAVPLISHEISWAGVRRLDLGGKVMTNLLKEQISFRQWDMTDETWLMAKLKERAFFVAASEYDDVGGRDERRPSEWTPKMLLKRGKALEQEFVLPDYTGNAKLARDKEKRYGRIVRGPGAGGSAAGEDGVDEAARDDAFIADLSALEAERKRAEKSGEDDDEDEDDEDDGDYRESGSEAGSESGVKAVAPPRPTPAAAQTKKQVSDDDEQILLLCHERWQIPEILFRPEQLGLTNTLPLPSLILSAIEAAAANDEAVRGLMLCNVFLIGGLSSLPGLRRRIEADLRAIAPTECPVRVQTLGKSAAMDGARQCSAKFLQAKMMSREQWDAEGSAGARHRFGSWSAATGTIHRVSRGGSTQAKSQR